MLVVPDRVPQFVDENQNEFTVSVAHSFGARTRHNVERHRRAVVLEGSKLASERTDRQDLDSIVVEDGAAVAVSTPVASGSTLGNRERH